MCFTIPLLHIPYKYWVTDYLQLKPDASERERQTQLDKWHINHLRVERWVDAVRGSEGQANPRGGFTFPHDKFSARNAYENYIKFETYANSLFDPAIIKRCSVQDEAEKWTLQIIYPHYADDMINNISLEHENWVRIERWAEGIVRRWKGCSCGEEFEYTHLFIQSEE